METPQAVESRIPSFLTCRAWAYLGMLRCHICSEEFDKKSDSIAVSHFIEDHNFLRHTAERITDLLFITPTVPNLKVLKVLQCFVCDTFVSSGVMEFKKHLSSHKELVMLYESPYCFSLHESDHKMTLHSSSCCRVINNIDVPPGLFMPMLFKKSNNSLNMVPLQGGKEVRALQILRALSISIQKTEQSDEAVVVDKDSNNNIQMPIPTQGNVPPVA